MISNNITQLIEAIIEKTISKKATWGKTSRSNEYKLFFEKGAITTDAWEDQGKDLVDFAIYNAFGDKIDSYYAERGQEDYDFLINLHNTAKRDFFQVEETISNLFDEVKADKKIGKRQVENPDLPF